MFLDDLNEELGPALAIEMVAIFAAAAVLGVIGLFVLATSV